MPSYDVVDVESSEIYANEDAKIVEMFEGKSIAFARKSILLAGEMIATKRVYVQDIKNPPLGSVIINEEEPNA